MRGTPFAARISAHRITKQRLNLSVRCISPLRTVAHRLSLCTCDNALGSALCASGQPKPQSLGRRVGAIQFLLDTCRCKRPNVTWAANSGFDQQSMIALALSKA